MTVRQQFRLPDVGEGLTEAEIVEWKVSVGDQVQVNDTIVDIETAKAVVALPSPWQGTVRALLVEPQVTIAVGTPIIEIETDQEPAKPGRIATLVGVIEEQSGTARRRRRRPAVRDSEPAAPVAASVRAPLAAPPVRFYAKGRGVDLRQVQPSSPDGIIRRADIDRASAPPQLAAEYYDEVARERHIPIRGVRKATAAAVTMSVQTIPHVTEFLTVDVTELMELRDRLNGDRATGVRLTPLAFAARAMCLAAAQVPEINSVWDEVGGQIVEKGYVHLGFAAATPRGLVVPTVKDADRMSLTQLAAALAQLTSAARAGTVTPAELTGGTVTITNIGVFGVDTGTPVINPGQSAILALGSIKPTPWVHQGQLAIRLVCPLALSFDHRLIDGEQGSKFLAAVGRYLADPTDLVS